MELVKQIRVVAVVLGILALHGIKSGICRNFAQTIKRNSAETILERHIY